MTSHLLEHLLLFLMVILNHVSNVPRGLLLHDLLIKCTAVEQLLQLIMNDPACRWMVLEFMVSGVHGFGCK